MSLAADGALIFKPTRETLAWASAARSVADGILADPEAQATHLRHGLTWFVGVDALPNDADGSIGGVPLRGPWAPHVPDLPLHRGQLSVIYPGYPQPDPDQSEANHRYRVDRYAAHMDGLLPEGPDRRRYAREFHAYILGIALNTSSASPTVYWRGSHHVLRATFRAALKGQDVAATDVTDVYQAARREIFETCDRVSLQIPRGGAFLLDPFVLHGTAPWTYTGLDHIRVTAFFRPQYDTVAEWLA